jgi:hypothetical protein
MDPMSCDLQTPSYTFQQEKIMSLIQDEAAQNAGIGNSKDISKIVLDRELAIRQLQRVHRQCDGLLAELKILMQGAQKDQDGAPEKVESKIHQSMDSFTELTKRIQKCHEEKVKLFEEIKVRYSELFETSKRSILLNLQKLEFESSRMQLET